MCDDGEPISRGQVDRRAAEINSFRDSLFVAAFFAVVVLTNGILAVLLIEFFQSMGWWEVQPVGAAGGAATLSGRLGPRHGVKQQNTSR